MNNKLFLIFLVISATSYAMKLEYTGPNGNKFIEKNFRDHNKDWVSVRYDAKIKEICKNFNWFYKRKIYDVDSRTKKIKVMPKNAQYSDSQNVVAAFEELECVKEVENKYKKNKPCIEVTFKSGHIEVMPGMLIGRANFHLLKLESGETIFIKFDRQFEEIVTKFNLKHLGGDFSTKKVLFSQHDTTQSHTIQDIADAFKELSCVEQVESKLQSTEPYVEVTFKRDPFIKF